MSEKYFRDKSSELAFCACKDFLAKTTRKQYSLNENVQHLGKRIDSFYTTRKEIILENISIPIDECLSIARLYLEAARIEGATYSHEEIKNGTMLDSEFTRNLANPETVFDYEGNANGITNFVGDLNNLNLIESEQIASKDAFLENPEILLEMLGLYWLSEAEKCIECEDIHQALDLIGEAFSVFEYSNGLFMWRESKKCSKEEQIQKACAARHAENRAIKESLRKWYEENKDKFSSKDKAAEEAIKQAPIAFRTARKWITEFCKHPSAGRG